MEGLSKRIRENFSWCKIPLTYGEAIQLENNSGKADEDDTNDNYNGSIASVQLFVILIAISSSTTISTLLSDRFDPIISPMTLTVYMAIGCFIMVLFHVYRDKVLATPPIDENPSDPKRDNLTLIGIIVFYTFSCVMDVFQIAAGVGCIDVWRSYGNGRDYYFATNIAFHVARVIFLGGETLFCINLNRSTFLERRSTRFALIFIQAANLSLWLDAVVHESISSRDIHPLPLSNTSHVHSDDSPNVSGHAMDCINFNTSAHQMTIRYVSPALHPFTIEFTLLVGECFAHWFFNCSSSKLLRRRHSISSYDALSRHEDMAHPTDTGSCEPLETTRCLEGVERPDSQRFGCKRKTGSTRQELVALSPIQAETEELTPLLSPGADHTPRSRRLARILSCAWLLFVISLNLLICTFALLYKLKLEDGDRNSTAEYLLGFVWLSLIVTIGFAYFVTRSHRTVREPFSGLDHILVWSSFGPITHCVLNSIAAVDFSRHGNVTLVPKYDVTVETFVFFQLLNVAEICFQLSFSLYAARLVVSGWRGTTWGPVALKGLVLYLAVTNGSLWFIGTIHSFDFGQLKGLKEGYFGMVGWRVVNNIVSPLLLFFRFNSCLILTRTYRRLRRSVP